MTAIFLLILTTLTLQAQAQMTCPVTREESLAFLAAKKVSIEDPSNIIELDFGSAGISDAELIQLCPLTSLTRLYLYNDSFPTSALTGSTLEHLSTLKNLTFLDLDSNQIQAQELYRLEGLSSLKILKLFNNPLKQGPKGLRAIDGLLKVPSLEYLSLQASTTHFLTDADVANLSVLGHHPSLASLQLVGNQIEGHPQALEALAQLKNLKSLGLSSVGLAESADFSPFAQTSLESLDLSDSPMSSPRRNQVGLKTLESLVALKNLRKLAFPSNLNDQHLQILDRITWLEGINLNGQLNPAVLEAYLLKHKELRCVKLPYGIESKIDLEKITAANSNLTIYTAFPFNSSCL